MNPNVPAWNNQQPQQQQQGTYYQQQPNYNQQQQFYQQQQQPPQQPPQQPQQPQQQFNNNPYQQQQAFNNQYNPYQQQQQFQRQQQQQQLAQQQHQQMLYQQQMAQQQQQRFYQQQQMAPQQQQSQQPQQQQQPQQPQQARYNQYNQNNQNQNQYNQYQANKGGNNQYQTNQSRKAKEDNWDSDDNEPTQKPQTKRYNGDANSYGNRNNNYSKPKANNMDDSDDANGNDNANNNNKTQNNKKKKRRRGGRKNKNKNNDNNNNNNNNKNNANSSSQSQSQSQTQSQSPSQVKSTVSEHKTSQKEDKNNVNDLIEKVNKLNVTDPAPVSTKKSNKSNKPNKENNKKQSQSQPKPPKPSKQPKPSKSSNNDKQKQKKEKEKTKSSKKQKSDSKKEELKENDDPSSTTKSSKKKKTKGKKNKITWNAHDEREHLNLVLIGHVDAGKSTISGQILLQTGQIDERTIQKYMKEAREKNRESWWIAYIMDEDDDERNKGKTVECGRAHFDTEKRRYTILDAPGHKNYVPNMISGASQADVAIMVISARRGEFEAGFDRGGQTREHGLLAMTLGISRVVVVVNKMDTMDWSKERYDDIEKKIKKFLVSDIGFKEKYINFLPISGQKGLNLTTNIDNKTCPWYKGKNLLDTLDGLKRVKRSNEQPLRIPCLDRYKGDKGIQAIGKVEAGIVNVGDIIMVMPTEVSVRISALSIDDTPVQTASSGENLLISFDKSSALTMDNIYGGCVICNLNEYTPIVQEFVAEIYLHELPNNSIMTVGYQAMFHCHNVSTPCEIIEIPHKVNKKNKKRSKKAPPFLRSHESAIAKIKIDHKCSIEPFDECAALGRFTLRDKGKTVVIGKIVTVTQCKSKNKNKKK